MYHNILIPIDLSEKNEVPVKLLSQWGAATAPAVTLLHVIETLKDIAFEDLEDFYRTLQRKADNTMDALRDELSAAGFHVHNRIVYGRRGKEILRFAEEEGIDLIVLRSHVMDRAHPGQGIGTLSHQIALLASCSVWLIR
jgi:nucleotide-binding universal stress UspA family protein